MQSKQAMTKLTRWLVSLALIAAIGVMLSLTDFPS